MTGTWSKLRANPAAPKLLSKISTIAMNKKKLVFRMITVLKIVLTKEHYWVITGINYSMKTGSGLISKNLI
jgi:hypothetical protein